MDYYYNIDYFIANYFIADLGESGICLGQSQMSR